MSADVHRRSDAEELGTAPYARSTGRRVVVEKSIERRWGVAVAGYFPTRGDRNKIAVVLAFRSAVEFLPIPSIVDSTTESDR
jgi:hypothetical protein